MFIVKTKSVTKEWNGKAIFRQVTMDIVEGEKVALYGRNGAGKTTLLALLRGEIEPDAGEVHRFIPLSSWGWLEQQEQVEEGVTLLAYVRSASPRIETAYQVLCEAERALQAAAAKPGLLQEALALYDSAYETYIGADGYGWETAVERALGAVGLPKEMWTLPIRALSGGQRTRAGIARLLAARPKVLLLDEPTNHLDADTMIWLQQWIKAYAGTVVLVSHDRSFLDVSADRIIELTAEGTTSYKGNYKAYREQKELERKTLAVLYRKQEQERQGIKESIRMYQQWYTVASRAAAKAESGITKPYYAARAKKHSARFHAKEKQLERLEAKRVEKPREAEGIRVAFGAGSFEAKTLLQASEVTFGFDVNPEGCKQEKHLFQGLQLSINRGDKLAIVGPNGAGKTTLLRVLLGQLQPSRGTVACHPELRVGYFSQQVEHLNGEESLLDSLLRVPGMTQTFARTILGCFLFTRDDAFRTIGSLSMGEKCRAAFLQLYFSGANLLVLDEPTNYLDIDARERMEEALAAYPGALIAVSHDAYFLRAVSNRVLALDGKGGVNVYEESYAEYERRGSCHPRTSVEQSRKDEYDVVELERAALMAKETLDTVDMAQIRTLSERLVALSQQPDA